MSLFLERPLGTISDELFCKTMAVFKTHTQTYTTKSSSETPWKISFMKNFNNFSKYQITLISIRKKSVEYPELSATSQNKILICAAQDRFMPMMYLRNFMSHSGHNTMLFLNAITSYIEYSVMLDRILYFRLLLVSF